MKKNKVFLIITYIIYIIIWETICLGPSFYEFFILNRPPYSLLIGCFFSVLVLNLKGWSIILSKVKMKKIVFFFTLFIFLLTSCQTVKHAQIYHPLPKCHHEFEERYLPGIFNNLLYFYGDW